MNSSRQSGKHATGFRSRLLVLGASNVRRSLLTWIELGLQRFPRPIDFLFVAGHGRSYGRSNNIFGWSLPGISESDWSSHWSIADNATRSAILTDIGNDLMYGSDVETLVKWVAICLQQMSHADRAIVLGLPIERAKKVHRGQFDLFRKIFFKKSLVTLEDVLERASRVDDEVRTLVLQAHMKWFTPLENWYGWDPIHIRRSLQTEAWSRVIDELLRNDSSVASTTHYDSESNTASAQIHRPHVSLRNRFRLIFSRANRQSWFRYDQGASQPYVYFSDGSQVSFY